MSARCLFYVTSLATYAIVATSHQHACEIIESQCYVEHDPRGLVRERLSAVLATELDDANASALPQWEYDVDGDDETLPGDADVAAETSHPRRRWPIRRWVDAQRLPPEPPTVEPCDDWRGPPTPDEVRAHHEAHTDARGVSRWCVEIEGGDVIVAIVTTDGILQWLPFESTRWRPADARLTPAAWPTLRGER